MRKSIATATLCFFALFLVQAAAHAQEVDVAYGGGTITAPAATTSGESLRGGYYNTISGDVLLFHHFGAGADVSWRGSQNNFPTVGGLLPYRPIFFDVNAVYAPPLIPRVQPQFEAGIGAEDVRFYSASFCNVFTGSCFASSKHFLGHFGVGLKLYLFGNFFVRPEADLYLVNNNAEFSSARATRVGLSIGYTLGPH